MYYYSRACCVLPTENAKKKPSRSVNAGASWSWQCDSNTRPADYESAALPTELCQHRPVFSDRKRYCSIKENASQQISCAGEGGNAKRRGAALGKNNGLYSPPAKCARRRGRPSVWSFFPKGSGEKQDFFRRIERPVDGKMRYIIEKSNLFSNSYQHSQQLFQHPVFVVFKGLRSKSVCFCRNRKPLMVTKKKHELIYIITFFPLPAQR